MTTMKNAKELQRAISQLEMRKEFQEEDIKDQQYPAHDGAVAFSRWALRDQFWII